MIEKFFSQLSKKMNTPPKKERNLKTTSVAFRPSLSEKIDIASKAQGISKGEFLRRAVINELSRLGISLSADDVEMKQGFRSDMPGLSKSAQAKRERQIRLIEKMKRMIPELPVDLHEIYKRELKF